MTYADIKFQGDFYLRVCRGKENLGDGYLSIQEWPAAAGEGAASAHSTRWMVVVTSNNFGWLGGGGAGCRTQKAVMGRQKQSGA